MSRIDLKNRLQENMAPLAHRRKPIRGEMRKNYVGKISLAGDRFVMMRLPAFGSNNRSTRLKTMIPVIKGHIRERLGTTLIQICIKPPALVLVLAAVFFGPLGTGCIAIAVLVITRYRQNPELDLPSALILPFLLFVIGYVLLLVRFRQECQTDRSFLEKILNSGNLTNAHN
ncbi:hypothetical protein [Niabella terrae]